MYATRSGQKKTEIQQQTNTGAEAQGETDPNSQQVTVDSKSILQVRAVLDDDRPETPEVNMDEEIEEERIVIEHPVPEVMEDGCPIWREEPMDMREIIDLLLADDDAYEEGTYCIRVPQICPGKSATFLVDTTGLEHIGDMSVDSYGSWSKSIGARSHSFQRLNDGTLKRVDVNRRASNEIPQWDIRITENRYAHPATEQKFRKWTYIVRESSGTPLRWAAIVYRWYCEPFAFKPLPHGNSRRPELRNKPYVRTKPSTFAKMKHSMAMAAGEDGASITSIILQNTAEGGETPKSLKQVRDLAWRSGIPFRLRRSGMSSEGPSGVTPGIEYAPPRVREPGSSRYKRPRYSNSNSFVESPYYYEEIPAVSGEDPLIGLKRRLIEKQIENEEIKTVVMQNTLELLAKLKKCEFLPMAVVPQENEGVMVQDNAMEYGHVM